MIKFILYTDPLNPQVEFFVKVSEEEQKEFSNPNRIREREAYDAYGRKVLGYSMPDYYADLLTLTDITDKRD